MPPETKPSSNPAPEPIILPVSSGSGGPIADPARTRKRWLIGVLVTVAVAGVAAGAWYLGRSMSKPAASQGVPRTSAGPTGSPEQTAGAVELATGKNYGNKYASGLLPVGDKKYSTTGAQKGSIYLCQANFVAAGQAGAQARGPWFVNNNTQYDINKKAHIAGSVSWTPSLSVTTVGAKRVITTNDLPNHQTGVFPVGSSDLARQYDANPNSIKAQSLTYTLDAAPVAGQPGCMGGEVGVMLTGAAIFNGFDAGGRDAGAWEVQDGCDGHPQNKGEYHYHTLSRCVTGAAIDKVLGFALDGFPITGPKVGEGNILTTDDLDECHGITSEIMLDGKKTKMYHYVMTQDFPYSVSCFRGKAVQAPGLPEVSGGATQGPQGGATPPPPPLGQPPR